MNYTVTEHMQMLLYSDEDYVSLNDYYKNKYKENPKEFGKYEYKRFYIKGAIECEAYKDAHFMICAYLKNSDNSVLNILYEDLGDCDFEFGLNKAKHKEFWFKQAIKNFENAILLGNSHVELYYKISNVYNQLCIFDKAIEYCKKAIEKDSSYYSAYYFKAKLHQNIGQYDEAIQTYKDLKNRFKNEDIYYSVGNIFELKGDIKNALKTYQKGYKEDEDNDKYFIYRNEMAACYEKLKDYDNVLKVYDNMLKDNTKNTSIITYIYNNIASFYTRIDDADNAIKYYEKTLKVRKNNTKNDSTYYNKSVAYKELSPLYYNYKKNYKYCLDYAKKALKLYKKCVKAWGMTFTPDSDIDFSFVVDCLIFIANATEALNQHTTLY